MEGLALPYADFLLPLALYVGLLVILPSLLWSEQKKNKPTTASFLKQDMSRTVVWPLCSEGTWTTREFSSSLGEISEWTCLKSLVPQQGIYLYFLHDLFCFIYHWDKSVFLFFGQSILSTIKISGTAKVFHKLNFNLLLFTLRTRLVYVTDFKWLFNRL